MPRLIFFFLFGALTLTGSAQLLNQGRLIFVKNTDLSVVGNFDNKGTVVNNGTVSLGGDWTNTGKYTAGTGTFILNGNVAQNIIHNKDSVFIWVLNGKGEKILKDQADILKELRFNATLLTTQGGNITIRSTGDITNTSSTAYVNGLLFREGTGKKFYPIGKNGRYVPVTLENVDGTNDLILGFEAFEPNAGLPGLGVKSLSTKRYWQMTKRGNGTFNGSLITLSLATDQDTSSPTDMIVAEALAADQKYRSIGQSAISTTNNPSITSSALITGSFFAVGVSELLDETSIFIPNAFSPAATNPDDQVIKIYGDFLSPDDFEFQVFSKWGNVIFETRSLQEMRTTGWNGNGNEISTDASLGVYSYVLRGKFASGNSFTKNGTITVLK